MKTNRNLNVFLIGAGRISSKHISAIDMLSDEGVNLVGVAELEQQKFNHLKLANDVLKVKDYLDPAIYSNCDLISILTESGSHYNIAKNLLPLGIDLLIEKPVTLRVEHALELERLSRLYNSKIYVVKQNRYNAAIQTCNTLIENGFIGDFNVGTVRVRWCRDQDYYNLADWRGTWKHDGGVLSNQAIHHIDLLQKYMGPVQAVTAFSGTFGVDIETEDTVVACLKFQSGALGTIEATTSVRPENLEGSLSLLGKKGTIVIGGHAINKISVAKAFDMNEEILMSVDKNPDTSDVYGTGHTEVYRNILLDKSGEASEVVTIIEAIKSLKIIHMIYRSIETNTVIHFDDPNINSLRIGK